MLLFIIAFNNCDKDFEASEKVENTTASENSRFHVRTGNNVSKKAITFLKKQTDNTLKVSLSNKSIVLSKSSFTARETAMGTVDTSKEIAVDNEYNTKHTFKVVNDGDPNTVINVIVVETADVIYEYFKKYSFQNNLPLNPDNTVNLNLFTGIIETYNSLGELTGALQVINGEVVNSGGNNDPCPDNDSIWDGWDDFFNQLNNNTSSGNNGGTNTDDGSNTSNENTQGGGEYTNPDDEEGCTVYQVNITCEICQGDLVGATHFTSGEHVNDSDFLVVRCGNYVVTTAQRNSNLTSRNPEDENPCGEGDVGVLIEIDDNCAITDEEFNLFYSTYSPFNVDLSSIRKNCDSISTIDVENEKFLCIYEKLTQSPKFKTLFLDIFDESEDLNVKFIVVDDIPGTTVGECHTISGQFNETTGELINLNLEIHLERGFLNDASAIAVAKTILHESIHAYLTFKYHGCNQSVPFGIMDDVEMSELLEEYNLECPPQQGQHEFMFNYMIPAMSEILAYLKDALIPLHQQTQAEQLMFINELNPSTYPDGSYIQDVPWSWDEFYKYLSMAGLQNSSAFHFAIGVAEPIDNQTPEYKNFNQYAVEIGTNQFRKECDE